MLYYEEVPSFEMPREIGPETTGNQFLSQYGCYDSLNNINELGLSQTPSYPFRGYSYPQSSRGVQNNGQHSYVRNCPPYGSIPQVLPNNISTYPTTSPGNGHYMTQSLDGVSRELQHRPNLRSSPYSPNLESFYDIPNNYHHSKLNRMFNEDYVLNSPPRENSYPLSYLPSSYGYPKLNGKLVDLSRVGYDDSIPISPEQIPLMDNSYYGDDGDRKRKFDESEDNDTPIGFKLPASKSPIMEAMAYCAIKRWGIEIVQCSDSTDDCPAKVVFRVLDFEQYYKYSCLVCSKQNPTEDIGSRVKSLRRWFVNFPKKRDRRENPQFTLEVKPEVSKKVFEMIEKYKCQISVTKRRRTK